MMQTKFTPLVKLKHSKLQESELTLQQQLQKLQQAKEALLQSQKEFETLPNPTNGSMHDFLVSRELFEAQRRVIEHNQGWVAYEQQQLQALQEAYKQATIEYEKFKYLELQEIQKIKKAKARQEAKDLDEVAMLVFERKRAG